MAHGAGLTGDAAAGNSGDNIHLAHLLSGHQGLADDQLQILYPKRSKPPENFDFLGVFLF